MIRRALCAFTSGVPGRVSATLIRSHLPNKTEGKFLLSRNLINQPNVATFTSLVPITIPVNNLFQGITKFSKNLLLEPKKIKSEQIRTVIKFSWKKGKRKSVGAVPARFFRLHWGIWIRTKAGRHKKLWKKSRSNRNRLQQHVFCNATQSRMLDTMVSKFWRKPRYYINDPYEVYHSRNEFSITRRKPWRPEGCDYE